MLTFCGQDKVLVDANGRIKLPVHFVEDFLSDGTGDVVFYCLPEGALAIYPEKIYSEMRKRDTEAIRQAGASMLKRRDLRRFGAWSSSSQITRQGRVTLPPEFRTPTMLEAGSEAMVIGVEIGVEIWNLKRWQDELKLINEHELDRGDLELAQDLKMEQ